MRSDEQREALAGLEATLTDTAVEHLVEMVLSHPEEGTYRAAAVDGSVTWRRSPGEGGWQHEVVEVEGRNPLGEQRTDHLLGLDAELAGLHPTREGNAYPYAYDQVAQLFDGPCAPDLSVVHTASHFKGNIGDHGSLGIVQARAPFIAAGAGIRAEGLVDRHARMVDVAPTVCAALGVAPAEGLGPDGSPRPGALLRRQDGDVQASVLDGERAEHAIVFLLDGVNNNVLLHAVDRGELPNVAALVERGTAYRQGLFASFPTATLANHTTANTGAHPGHSGVLHNEWFDRRSERHANLLSPDQLFTTMQHLHPAVETIHQAVHRTWPDAWTASIYEFVDVGADLSSFDMIHRRVPFRFPSTEEPLPFLDPAASAASEKYTWMARVDTAAMWQAVEHWGPDAGHPLPRFTWVSFSLTDEASHEGGPHSELAAASLRESDARLGEVLAAVERAGALERTAVFVIADHGMEATDPANDGTYFEALDEVGVSHRHVAEGFVYLR